MSAVSGSTLPDFTRMPFARAARGEAAAGTQAGAPWETPEGIPVKGAYEAADRAGLAFVDGMPGIAPFLRGPYPTMYVNQPWTVRQYAGFSTARGFERLLPPQPRGGPEGGCRSPSTSPRTAGYDSDHPRVAGDVGMAGVAIDSIYDMRTLFSGIPLDQMSVSMTMNGAVLPVMALYIVAAEEQGVSADKLAGHESRKGTLTLKEVHGPQTPNIL